MLLLFCIVSTARGYLYNVYLMYFSTFHDISFRHGCAHNTASGTVVQGVLQVKGDHVNQWTVL
jgi:hypothetical protein